MDFLSFMYNCSGYDLEDNVTLYLFNLKEGFCLIGVFDVRFIVF